MFSVSPAELLLAMRNTFVICDVYLTAEVGRAENNINWTALK
jgi:hypothetical protein